MNAASLTSAISTGEYDHAIEELKQAIVERSLKLKRSSHCTGDTVKIIGPIRPNYLINHLATVVRVNANTITIDLLQPVRGPQSTKSFHKNLRIPVENIAKVEPHEEKAYRDNLKKFSPPPARPNRWTGKPVSLQDIREMRRQEAAAELAFESRSS